MKKNFKKICAAAERERRAREILGEVKKFDEDLRRSEQVKEKLTRRHMILQRGGEYKIIEPSRSDKVGALHEAGWMLKCSVELPEGFTVAYIKEGGAEDAKICCNG